MPQAKRYGAFLFQTASVWCNKPATRAAKFARSHKPKQSIHHELPVPTATATVADDDNLSLPCFLSVKHGRKAVCVLNWGQAPFAVEPKCNAIIPNNFQVETKFLDTQFIASTLVDAEGRIQYQFKTGTVSGRFCVNATAALQSVADCLGEQFQKRFRRGTGGMLHIGVSYLKIQEAIKQVHASQLHLVIKAPVPPVSPALKPAAPKSTKPASPALKPHSTTVHAFRLPIPVEAEDEDVVIASQCLLRLKSSERLLDLVKRQRIMSEDTSRA
ncbi:hypothetical protein BASA81_010624 [Batrachochytrium salamandrivorans]|nr:hypothetical protein BASA81_010624 [Batrachochytrium salamandrivorans]